jgi:cytochrome P450
MTLPPFDPFSAEAGHDPYSVYARYRTHDPVNLGVAPMPEYPPSWYVFRHADAAAVLKNPDFIHDRTSVLPPQKLPSHPTRHKRLWDMLRQWLLLTDPPRHGQLRVQLAGAFDLRAVRALGGFVSQTVDHLLTQGARAGGMDLMRDFAFPLPVAVISKLLGIAIPDVSWFRGCSKALADAIDVRPSSESHDRATQAVLELTDFVLREIESRRRSPRKDFLSSLLERQSTGEGLTETELIAVFIFLLFAGQETTCDFLGNSLLALLTQPEACVQLREHRELVAPAIDELLRFDAPVQFSTFRIATCDVNLGGKVIRKGDNATVVIGSANRDPDRFVKPDKLDFRRHPALPSLVFGQGIHFCLGANLARMEGRLALDGLLRRFPSIRLLPETVARRRNVSFRGLTSVQVAF